MSGIWVVYGWYLGGIYTTGIYTTGIYHKWSQWYMGGIWVVYIYHWYIYHWYMCKWYIYTSGIWVVYGWYMGSIWVVYIPLIQYIYHWYLYHWYMCKWYIYQHVVVHGWYMGGNAWYTSTYHWYICKWYIYCTSGTGLYMRLGKVVKKFPPLFFVRPSPLFRAPFLSSGTLLTLHTRAVNPLLRSRCAACAVRGVWGRSAISNLQSLCVETRRILRAVTTTTSFCVTDAARN